MNRLGIQTVVMLCGALAGASVPVRAGDTLVVDVGIDPGVAGAGLKAATVQLSYPKELSIPGTAAADSVRERVTQRLADPGKDDLLMVNDDDTSSTLRIVFVQQPLDQEPVKQGDLVRVTFDRSGTVDATAVHCAVVGASDQTGKVIDGARCTVHAAKP